jgi:hypothetical protein
MGQNKNKPVQQTTDEQFKLPPEVIRAAQEIERESPRIDVSQGPSIHAPLPGFAPYTGPRRENEFGKGLYRGVGQLGQAGHAVIGMGAELAGQTEFKDQQLKMARQIGQNISKPENAAAVNGLQNIKSLDDALSWAVGVTGEQIPIMGAMATAGVVTGGAGAAATSIGMETGSIYQNIAETTGKSGKKEAAVAGIYGTLAGALDALPVMRILKKTGFAKAAEQGILKKAVNQSLLTTGVMEGIKQAGLEGGQELAQTALEHAALSWITERSDLFDEATKWDLLNSTAAGMLLGGATGVMASPAIQAENQQKFATGADLKTFEEHKTAQDAPGSTITIQKAEQPSGAETGQPSMTGVQPGAVQQVMSQLSQQTPDAEGWRTIPVSSLENGTSLAQEIDKLARSQGRTNVEVQVNDDRGTNQTVLRVRENAQEASGATKAPETPPQSNNAGAPPSKSAEVAGGAVNAQGGATAPVQPATVLPMDQTGSQQAVSRPADAGNVAPPATEGGGVDKTVEPIRKLGTNDNVYFETDKYRVNDTREGGVLLNIHDNTKDPFPIANIEFDSPHEAVFVASKLNKIYPDGVPQAVLLDKVIDNIKNEYKTQPAQAPATPPAEEPKKAATAGKEAEWGSTNKLITKDQADQARKVLFGGETTLYSGLPVEHIKAMTTLGLFHAEAGARKFKEWSDQMITDMGERVKPYLPVIWDLIKKGGQVNLGPEAFPKDVQIGKWKGLAIDPKIKLTPNNRKALAQKARKDIISDPFYQEISTQMAPVVNPIPTAGKVLVSDEEWKGEILSQNPELRKYFISASQAKKSTGTKPMGWDIMLAQMADADPRVKADQSLNYYIDQVRSYLVNTKKTKGVNPAALEEARQHPYLNMLATKLEMLEQGKSREEINQNIQDDIEYYGIGEYGGLTAKTDTDIVTRTGREKQIAGAYEKKMAALNAELTRARQGQPAKQPTIKQQINQTTGVTKTEPPIVTAYDALNYALKHEAKGSMTGYRSGLLEKKATQKEIIEFMETHLPESERGKLMRAVSNLEPGRVAHREKLISAINVMQNKYEQKKANDEFVKLRKKVIKGWKKIPAYYKAKIQKLIGSVSVLRISPEREMRLRNMLETNQKTPDTFSYQQTAAAQRIIDDIDATPLRKMPADSIKQVTQQLKDLYEDVQIIQRIAAIEEGIRTSALKDGVLAEVQKVKPIDSLSEAAGFDPQKSFMGTAWHEGMYGPQEQAAEIGPEFTKVMMTAPQNGQTNVYAENKITENRLAEVLKKYGLYWEDKKGKKHSVFFASNATLDMGKVKGFRKVMGVWHSTEKLVGLRTDADKVTLNLPNAGKTTFNSWAEVMYISAHLSIPENRSAVLQGGLKNKNRRSGPVLKITSNDANVISDSLPADLRNVVDWIVSEMGKRGKVLINEASNKLTGGDIATIDHYFPMLRSMIDKVRDLSEMLRDWRKTLENLGFLKSREGSKLPILYGDIFELYFEHMNKVAQYAKLAPALRDGLTILGDPDIAQAMNNQLGTQSAKFWLMHLDSPIQKYRSAELGDSAINMIYSNTVKSVLRLNPSPMLKNLQGLITAWPQVGTDNMLTGLTKVGLHTPKEMVEQSPDMWHRYHLGAMEMVSPSFDIKLLHEGKLDTTMSPLWHSDRLVASILWEALKAKGLTGKQLAIAHRDLINKTQNPTDALNMPQIALESKNNPLKKGITLFMTDAVRQMSLMRHSLWEIKRGIDVQKNITQIVAIAIVGTLWGMGVDELRSWVYRGFKDREEKYQKTKMDWLWDFVGAQLNRIYVVGDLYSTVRNWRKFGRSYNESMPQQIVNDAAEAIGNTLDMIEHLKTKETYQSGKNKGELKWVNEAWKAGKAITAFGMRITGFPSTPYRIGSGVLKSQEEEPANQTQPLRAKRPLREKRPMRPKRQSIAR